MYQATPKQYLKLNSWKVKQHWGWAEKKALLDLYALNFAIGVHGRDNQTR